MLKLVKYELRKNRTALLVLLAILVALEAYFLLSVSRQSDADVIIAMSLLSLAIVGCSFAVFIFGISSYSGELKRKSSYLIFMTPNSTLSVIVSKLLFTLVIAMCFSGLAIALMVVDVPVTAQAYGEWEGYFVLFDSLLLQQGISVHEILISLVLSLAEMFLQLLSYVGVAYLSITISATVLNGRKGRGFLSFAIFCAITYGLACISGLYSYISYEAGEAVSYIGLLAPALLQSIVVLAVSTVLSAWMLKKHVAL